MPADCKAQRATMPATAPAVVTLEQWQRQDQAVQSAIVRTLSRAYCTYHSFNWAFEQAMDRHTPEDDPQRAKRTRQLRWLYAAMLDIYAVSNAICYCVLVPTRANADADAAGARGDGHDGRDGRDAVACLMVRRFAHVDGKLCVEGAGARGPTFADYAWNGALVAPFVLGFRAYSRMNQQGARSTKVHKEFARLNGRHWRMDFVATMPDYQGQGQQSKLIRHVLQEAGACGACVYLSTSDPTNTVFYRRLGFKDVGAARTDADMCTVGMAWTPPGSPAAIHTGLTDDRASSSSSSSSSSSVGTGTFLLAAVACAFIGVMAARRR